MARGKIRIFNGEDEKVWREEICTDIYDRGG